MPSRSRDAVELWEDGMEKITVCFTSIGISKKLSFDIRIRLSDRIEDLMRHLKASKGITGRLIMERELSKRMTLAEAGIHPGTVIEIESYNPAKRFSHNIPLKLPNGIVIFIQVHSSSTIGDLKHKIQDEIGMPAEDQTLEYSGRRLKQDKLSVDICGHKKTPLVVKWVPKKDIRGTERPSLAASNPQAKTQKHHEHSRDKAIPNPSQLPSTSTPQHADYGGLSTGEDSMDGPWPRGKHKSYTDEGDHKTHTDEESHHQDHTQVPYGTHSLVERVPDTQPSEPQLEQISSKMVKWEGLAIHLGIDEPKRYEIQRNHNEYGRQKLEMLYEWRRQNGGSATWKVLVETSLKVRNKQLAEDIVEIWESSQLYQPTVKPPKPVNPETAMQSPSPESSRASFAEIGSPPLSARRGSILFNAEHVASRSPRAQRRTAKMERHHAGTAPRMY